MEYGIINSFGHLETRETDNEKQIAQLTAAGFKPVDSIDSSKLQCEDGFFVRVSAYDAGERISFNYETVLDKRALQKQIDELKAELSASDYKIAKCAEASLMGQPLPYDIAELHSFRQSLRDKIGEIAEKL